MLSKSNNFGQLNDTENCSNLTQITPSNSGDMLHHTYHAWKRDADADYLGRVKIALRSHVGGINFADPANIRKAHEELMT